MMENNQVIAQKGFTSGNNPLFTGRSGPLSLLERVAPEEKRNERKILVSRQDFAAIKPMIGVFHDFLAKWQSQPSWNYKGEMKRLKLTARHIELFSLCLNEISEGVDWKAWQRRPAPTFGHFISFATSISKDTAFVVHTAHLDFLLEDLCTGKHKSLRVRGSVGRFCGREMKNGSILVEGDAADYLGGGMTGGQITVLGSAGERCGGYMTKGMIEIGGKAGSECGILSKGGEIRVAGSIAGIHETCKAAVYDAGRLVWGEPELGLTGLIADGVRRLFARIGGNAK